MAVLDKNPIVYLDIRIGKEDVGRIVIELMEKICPKTCENFRALCTGERGADLCYRGSKFHKVIKLCHAQGGDIAKHNGSSGVSIYGKFFEDENFTIKHDRAGVVSMANFGRPNTNNSQFFITSYECNHMDGENVAFGYVRKGLGTVNEMEKCVTDEGEPKRPIVIVDCGEIPSGSNDWGYCDNDSTSDKLPPFPQDFENFNLQMELNEKLKVLNTIKESGNYFYRNGNYNESSRKYRKFTRYYNHFKSTSTEKEEIKMLDLLQLTSLTNLAASELKNNDYDDVIFSCTAAIEIDPNNKKAYFRRGVAHIELKNYERALDDLKMALKFSPNNVAVIKEFERAKQFLLNYREVEKNNFKKLFQ